MARIFTSVMAQDLQCPRFFFLIYFFSGQWYQVITRHALPFTGLSYERKLLKNSESLIEVRKAR